MYFLSNNVLSEVGLLAKEILWIKIIDLGFKVLSQKYKAICTKQKRI